MPPLVSGLVFGAAFPFGNVATGPIVAITVVAALLAGLVHLVISCTDGAGPDTRAALVYLIPIAVAAAMGVGAPRLPGWAAAALLTGLLWITIGIAAWRIRQIAEADLGLREMGYAPVTIGERTVWVLDAHRDNPATRDAVQRMLSEDTNPAPPART